MDYCLKHTLGDCYFYKSLDGSLSSFAYHLREHMPSFNDKVPREISDIDYITMHYAESGIVPFDFNKPSPDDVVIAKQSKAFNPPTKKGPEKKKGPIIVIPAKKVSKAPIKEKVDVVKKVVAVKEKKVKQMAPAVREGILRKIKSENKKDELHVCFIGNSQTGKSTILGHLLYLDGQVDKKTIDKFSRDCEKLGRPGCQYAYVVDSDSDERKRGMTTDVSIGRIDTNKSSLSFIDCPGNVWVMHRSVGSMVQSHASVLVLDASNEAYHKLVKKKSTPREILMIAKSMGIQQLIVAINKMDAISWDQSRYKEIIKDRKSVV